MSVGRTILEERREGAKQVGSHAIALTLLRHLFLFSLGQCHIGECVGLGRDDLVKVDLVHAALVIQAHFFGQGAKVLRDSAHERKPAVRGSSCLPLL